MSVAELKDLPLREKLQIMEEIWLELRGNVAGMAIPEDHRKLLDARRARVESGQSELHDWDEVKNGIGRR
jgi:hypothetical protein